METFYQIIHVLASGWLALMTYVFSIYIRNPSWSLSQMPFAGWATTFTGIVVFIATFKYVWM